MLKYLEFIKEEMEFNSINCSYTTKIINNVGVTINTFSFITNNGNSYTVYTHDTKEDNHLLDDGTYLYHYTKKTIPTIYFSETYIGLDPTSFGNLTNKGEFMEVMGKVIYILTDFISNNKQYNVFSIGGIDIKKLIFYKNWLKNLPISDIKVGLSNNYFDTNGNKTKAYYLIR